MKKHEVQNLNEGEDRNVKTLFWILIKNVFI